MRNPDRLDSFYELMHDIHKNSFPDFRFGQLISNFFSWCLSTGRCFDIFFPEENEWKKWIIEYAKEYGDN